MSPPTPLATLSDEEVVAFLRRFLPDFYFVNAPLSRMKRHMALLNALPQAPSGVVIEFHRAPGASFSELVLCARDPSQPGLLSNIAATLAAAGVSVHTAWIHSLDAPTGSGQFGKGQSGASGERIALDTFILGENQWGRSRALSNKTQKAFLQTLSGVLRGEQSGDELLFGARRARQKAARAPLQISDASSTRMGEFSLFKVRAHDSSGVFFRITRALARHNVHIEHAQINTFEHEADDVFFVLDARTRQPFSDEDAAAILKRLRGELSQNE